MDTNRSRRKFLLTAPLAAAALPLSDSLLHAAVSENPAGPTAPAPYQVISAEEIEKSTKVLQAAPGNKDLYNSKALPFQMVLTSETAKSAAEYEWHEGRDHILQVVEGSTVYELGGTPVRGRKTKPGEWLAPEAEGAIKVTLKKGDTLIIPRNTLHKRSTSGSVTFTLISPVGSVSA